MTQELTAKPKTEIETAVATIAARIALSPDPWQLDREVRGLIEQHGDWFAELLVDRLTQDVGYSQSVQDHLHCIEINHYWSVPVILLGDAAAELRDKNEIDDILDGLVPADVNQIPRLARLRPVERDVLYYTKRGYSVVQMSQWLVGPRGLPYRPDSIRRMRARVSQKIQRCPEIGIRTALAQDLHRGPRAVPPGYWSQSSFIIEEERREALGL